MAQLLSLRIDESRAFEKNVCIEFSHMKKETAVATAINPPVDHK